MDRSLSWLERLYFRLEAQHACLAWAFAQIAGRPGMVFEIGLGHGRTFDHLRRHLPDRDIYVFDREIDSYPECTPEPRQMITGELSATLPAAAARFAGQVIFAHSDIGSFSAERNAAVAGLVSAHLPKALAEGAVIVSDLPLAIRHATQLPLPPGARDNRYFIYRFARGQ